ncbi:F0F1 ATP synthase subunit epsilon, partial [Gemmatimonadota bacterium]
MASSLSVRVVSPAKEVFNGQASSLVAPAWDGMVGILPDHAPLITLLGHGELAVDVPGGGERAFLRGRWGHEGGGERG